MSEFTARTSRELHRQVAIELALGAHLRAMEASAREYRFKEDGTKPTFDMDAAFVDAERIFEFLRGAES
jgi:hypothetical protein